MSKLVDKLISKLVKNLEKWCGLENEETKLNDSYNSNFKSKLK